MPIELIAKDLSAGYDRRAIFRHFDLSIPPGKITTLIGANGSGKSTILKTMARLLRPLDGTVLLDGASIHSLPTKQVAQKLAMLPQGAQTPEAITVHDLVEYGRYPYRGDLPGAALRTTRLCAGRSNVQICWSWRSATWISSPAVSGSVRGSPWRWRRKRGCFFWMSQQPIWIFLISWRFCSCCGSSIARRA